MSGVYQKKKDFLKLFQINNVTQHNIVSVLFLNSFVDTVTMLQCHVILY